MIGFLKNIWGFVRPYRGRFFLGLLCGVFYGLTNGLLLGVSKVVMQLTFKNNTDLQKKLEGAPHWIQPLSHWLADRLPDLHAPRFLGQRGDQRGHFFLLAFGGRAGQHKFFFGEKSFAARR